MKVSFKLNLSVIFYYIEQIIIYAIENIDKIKIFFHSIDLISSYIYN